MPQRTRAQRGRRAVPALLIGAALVLLTSALTTSLVLADSRVLHEFFIIPLADRQGGPSTPTQADAPTGDDSAARQALSDALNDGDDDPKSDLGPPPLTIENSGDELELNADGAPVTPDGKPADQHNGPLDAPNQTRPDRNTKLDADLDYFTVFNPSVVPWKRGGARDQVRSNYGIDIRDRQTYKLRVRDTPVRDGYERFWGSVLVRMEPHTRVPLPSVAPRANIVRYQTEPPTFLEFHRDMADNYYVSSNTRGAVRVNYLMEAPSSYFGGDIDPNVRVQDLPVGLRPKLPERVQAAADRAIAHIGIDRQGSFRDQLRTLVGYFRAFKAQDFPDDLRSQDIYLDLTLNQLGVCRHRAFAFVVTAHALGILARYVYNEAHAFVEVKIPKRGWLRIDLGGAAVNFEVRNNDNKLLHTPPEADALPQPPDFSSSYSHRLGQNQPDADIDADGSSEPIEGAEDMASSGDPASILGPQDDPQPPPGQDGVDEGGPSSFEPEPSDGEGDGPDGAGQDDAANPDDAAPKSPAELKFPQDAAAPAQPAKPRRPSKLTILRASDRAFRGDTLQVFGKLTSNNGRPIGGQRVEAFLVPSRPSPNPDEFERVGAAVSNPQGQVAINVIIPETVALGRWSLHLYYPGDEDHAPTHSK